MRRYFFNMLLALFSALLPQLRGVAASSRPGKELQTDPFTLSVRSDGAALRDKKVSACAGRLRVGGQTCTWCYDAPPMYACGSYGNKTVLLPGGEMAADVPGGQYWYIDPDEGSLQFTGGGKANGMGMIYAGKNVTVYKDGGFVHDDGADWLACREREDGEEGRPIYAPGSGHKRDCDRVRLEVSSVSGRKQGAYVYD